MATIEEPGFARNAKRRVYAFLAVALAVFLLGITIVGMVCKGYAMQLGGVKASPAAPLRMTPEEAATTLAAANDECNAANHDAANAIKAYEAANAELAVFIKTHFAELNGADILNESASAGPAIESAPPSVMPAPAAPRTIVNPQWTDIRNQLDKLQRRRSELLATMLPSHPTVQAIDSSIAEVESQLKAILPEIPAPSDWSNEAPIATQPATIANNPAAATA